jgi:hypothetical protein
MQHHIVDIVHIDENMTRLIDFHGLGSTFSDRMRTKGFAIYSTHNSRTGKPFYLLVDIKNFPDVFKIPTKKTSFRRFKSV